MADHAKKSCVFRCLHPAKPQTLCGGRDKRLQPFSGHSWKSRFLHSTKRHAADRIFNGLPAQPEHRVFGFHIHEGDRCAGNAEDPFADAKAHYNPQNTLHPYHAGDLPPVFSNEGWAWYAAITTRFHSEEIIGKTMILHAMPDDLMTQPSGNSGEKIACGIIRKTDLGFPRSRIF